MAFTSKVLNGRLTQEGWIKFTRRHPINHLMTGAKGNREFYFPETPNASPKAKPRRTLTSRGNRTHCFPTEPVMKCFVIPQNSKIQKNCKNCLLDIFDWHTKLTVSRSTTQGLYGSWKTWKVLEFCFGIFQDWKVLEKGYWSWKVLEIC